MKRFYQLSIILFLVWGIKPLYANLQLIRPEPAITVQPASYDFGDVQVSSLHNQRFVISNTGTDSLSISSVVISGNEMFFIGHQLELPSLLVPGDSLGFVLTYAPTITGQHSASIVIDYDATPVEPEHRYTYHVPVSGSAIANQIIALPYSQSFNAATPPNLPEGWSKIVQPTNYPVVQTTINDAYSPPNSIRMNNSLYTNATVMLVMPPLAAIFPANSICIKFWARGGNQGYSLKIGVMTDATDAGSFSQLHSVSLASTWQQYRLSLAGYAGNGNVLAFKHGLGGTNRNIYLDDVELLPLLQHDLAIAYFGGDVALREGIGTTFRVDVFNWGMTSQTDYTIRLLDSGGTELAVLAGTGISPAQSVSVDIPWTPASSGNFTLYTQLDVVSDEAPENNLSRLLPVVVYEDGIMPVTIGGGEQNYRIPLDMNYRCSLFETIYSVSELNSLQGNITGVIFYNNFSQDVLQKPVSIWLGTTTLNDLSEGWISASQLYMMFNGLVDFPAGDNGIFIPFPYPFPYTNSQNLAMMVMRPMDDLFYFSSNYFRSQSVGATRSRKAQSDEDIYNPTAPPAASTLSGQFPRTTFVIQLSPVGTISGYVTDSQNTPLSEVVVNILNTELSTFTNLQGYFTFQDIPPGAYELLITKHGYASMYQSIYLEQDETEQITVQLVSLPLVNVSGLVSASDTGTWLPAATVELTGYDNYTAFTDEQGAFTIPDVYAFYSYSYCISADGYTPRTGVINLGAVDYQMESIALTELAYPAANLTASIIQNPIRIELTWALADSVRVPRVQADNPSQDAEPQYSNRTWIGYRIWRLTATQQNSPDQWTLLTAAPITDDTFADHTWQYLADGYYMWAVKAFYSNGVVSLPAFSNVLLKETAVGALTGVVTGAQGQPISGASITAGTYAINTNSSGAYNLIIPAGIYSVSASMLGYYIQTFNAVAVAPNENTTLNFSLSPVSNSDETYTPPQTRLLGNYPNPFNPETIISYTLSTLGMVSLQVFNLKGQLVRTLVRDTQFPGTYQVVFNSLDDNGKRLSSGMYLYRFSTGHYHELKKMILLE